MYSSTVMQFPPCYCAQKHLYGLFKHCDKLLYTRTTIDYRGLQINTVFCDNNGLQQLTHTSQHLPANFLHKGKCGSPSQKGKEVHTIFLFITFFLIGVGAITKLYFLVGPNGAKTTGPEKISGPDWTY